MKKFPSYDLQSKQGTEMAIRDMESKLSAVASFEYTPAVCEVTKNVYST